MHKKSIILISCLTLFILLGISSIYNEPKIILGGSNNEKVINTNALTMMYETEVGSGEYQVTSDATWPQDGYAFNETLSKCENGSILTWDDENQRVVMQANTSDKCYVYFDKELLTLANYIINNVYTGIDGDNDLYYHNGTGSCTNADQEAGDYSYRYSGANPNNYVCFGSDDATCPSDNLYRVIGVFDDTGEYQVKLIKYDYANSDLLGLDGAYNTSTYTNTSSSYYEGTKTTINRYYWNNSSNTNAWSESNLNTVNLNTNYLNSIGSKWSDSIIANGNYTIYNSAVT